MDRLYRTGHQGLSALNLLTLGLLSANSALAADTELPALTVTGEDTSGYQADSASVAGFDTTTLLDTPAAVTVLTDALIKDQQARLLSEVLRNDASVGQAYAPVGYYENFVVRGYSLNSASSYRINDRTITGEQNVGLENKQQVELLKGLSGLESGVSEPGGLVNYVTKRPTEVRQVTVSTDDRGSGYLATDIGGFFGSEQQFGLRANLAHEDIHSYVEHANGQRDFASWPLTGTSAPMRCCNWTPSTRAGNSARRPATNCWVAPDCRTMPRRKNCWPTRAAPTRSAPMR